MKNPPRIRRRHSTFRDVLLKLLKDPLSALCLLIILFFIFVMLFADRIVPYELGIIGGSYGGYAALCAITEYPELWSAAVDIVGMSNLETFLENTAPYRRSHREGEYGSLANHREVLRRLSPIHKADRIAAPLMVIHGTSDPRVPVSEAEQIVNNLRSRGIAVQYLCYGDEGHGIMKLANKLHCYPQVSDFLKKHLT